MSRRMRTCCRSTVALRARESSSFSAVRVAPGSPPPPPALVGRSRSTKVSFRLPRGAVEGRGASRTRRKVMYFFRGETERRRRIVVRISAPYIVFAIFLVSSALVCRLVSSHRMLIGHMHPRIPMAGLISHIYLYTAVSIAVFGRQCLINRVRVWDASKGPRAAFAFHSTSQHAYNLITTT